MQTPTSVHDQDAICAALIGGRCALCDAPLSTFDIAAPCPHWFLENGARGFQLDSLRRTFRRHDVASVIDYLRIVAEFEGGDNQGRPPFVERSGEGLHEVDIRWRDRAWTFSHAPQAPQRVSLATWYRGVLVARGEIHPAR